MINSNLISGGHSIVISLLSRLGTADSATKSKMAETNMFRILQDGVRSERSGSILWASTADALRNSNGHGQ